MSKVIPFSLKDAPALIEHALPVQRLSVEAYKEQMAGQGKTLTALGSYWKGRKPLILSRACILGALLPVTNDLRKDIEIFEMLMGMDDASLAKRNRLESSESLPSKPYLALIAKGKRPEELGETLHSHIWLAVNVHLGTNATSVAELVEQLGIMRFGHRPKVADTFCGSGQIPFEAARLGCDVHASDLNPIASLLTWGALNIVGGSPQCRSQLVRAQQNLTDEVLREIDRLGVESDGNGWRGKTYLYCVESRCPQTGWMVPLIPSLVVSRSNRVVARLIPDPQHRRYDIEIRSNVSQDEVTAAEHGTVRSEGRGQGSYLVHHVNGMEYRTSINTLRGDYHFEDGSIGNRLRLWEKSDFMPRRDDIYQERLYAIQWMRTRAGTRREEFEFRSVTDDDIRREDIVQNFVASRLAVWQEKGWIPDMRIEPGEKTNEPIRTRGWTYWHHLFSPRHLLSLATIHLYLNDPASLVLFSGVLDFASKLTRWTTSNIRVSRDGSGKQVGGASDNASNVFYNQALNALFNYGCRSTSQLLVVMNRALKQFPVLFPATVTCAPAAEVSDSHDIYITDPPYGDAVKYEEILEFFIAWLRKNPPPEFAGWVWDSRRSLAIKGEDEAFRRSMVAAYKRMAECMPDNGIQVIMFTHQSGSIWADMANIVWASGLQVTAAWYVVTETDSALREGSYVKGTVLLVLRKRQGTQKTSRDELAWDIKDEVERQVATLTGLNQQVRSHYRDENLFADADLQMAGYAAALRVLTQYSIIDGKDMVSEAIRPRVKGETTFVDELIEFAVGVANQSLVPQGIERSQWEKMKPAERFYLKLLDLESKGVKTLDNYQNFAKAFKVGDFKSLMASQKANAARLRSAAEFGRAEMSEGAELAGTPLRGVLYAMMELAREADGEEVLAHLGFNVPNFFDPTMREMVVELADYLATKLVQLRPEEAAAARVLRELVRNQRL